MSSSAELLTDVDRLLASGVAPPWDDLLAALLTHFDCVVGTVHVLQDDRVLHLTADRGLPPPVRDKVAMVPIGKGMAGIAAERREPVQVCNLQTDDSGVVRPGAKLTQMEGSIAIPMLDGDRLTGVLGVAKPVAYDFTDEESATLMAVGAKAAAALAS
ncbi:MAG: GAF domain-containing protein [bacterium]|nr:GAF domain-containing protein [bacterium]